MSISQTMDSCVVSFTVTVTATGALDATLTYAINDIAGNPIQLSFTSGHLSETVPLPETADGNSDGGATAEAGGVSAPPASWTACSTG